MPKFYKWMAGFGVMLVVLSFRGRAAAQVNSWINPASAAWETANWSLGVLPGSAQSVMITNAGYKAIGISPATRINDSNSMTVSNLAVSAPTNAFNTLLLNFFGTGMPLEVLDACTIDTNGLIENLYSAFEVSGYWVIDGGQYIEQGGSTIATNATTFLLDGGSLNLSNADFKLGKLVLGLFDTFSDTEMVNQAGGKTDCQLTILDGSYTVSNGTFSGTCSVGGEFTQYGGTNEASISIGGLGEFDSGGGTYNLFQGAVACPSIRIAPYNNADGYFNQVGGTVVTAGISVGSGGGNGGGLYSLTNGTLLAGTVGVDNSYFWQTASRVSITNSLTVYGGLKEDAYGDLVPTFSDYSMDSGELSCASLEVGEFGYFGQSGGTNTVAGDLGISAGGYGLSSGVLLTSNTILSVGFMETYDTPGGYSIFEQDGGQQWTSNTLSDFGFYYLWGGSLYASNIVLEGLLSVSNPAVILNPGLFEFAGTLQIYGGVSESLGTLQLTGNSFIALMPGTHRLEFLNSSALAWNSRCSLLVSNWNGSTNGGGADQLLFGNNSSGLTPAQLRQIAFVNPAGFPVGNYAAKILSAGEVVPLPNPILSWQTVQGQLIMSWSGGAILQSSTNVLGPYTDISNAPSPYTNTNSPGASRFFRLRH